MDLSSNSPVLAQIMVGRLDGAMVDGKFSDAFMRRSASII